MNKDLSEDKTNAGTPAEDLPPAGPHETPEQTDKMKTPGTGALNDDDENDVVDVGPD